METFLYNNTIPHFNEPQEETARKQAQQAICSFMEEVRQAILTANVEKLRTLIAPDVCLWHMVSNAYLNRDEWLNELKTGRIRFRHIELTNVQLTLTGTSQADVIFTMQVDGEAWNTPCHGSHNEQMHLTLTESGWRRTE